MFAEKSLRDRLVCFAEFAGTSLLAVIFLQSLSNFFLKVCPPTLFAAVFNFFCPLETSAISGAANSNKSAPRSFVAGTIFIRKNASSPNYLCKCTEGPSTMSTNTFIQWNIYFSWNNHLVTSFRLELKVGGLFKHQNKTSDTDRYQGYF